MSRHGFWLLVGSRELFAPFDEFPWFRDATIGELTDVELRGRELLRWPQLDVDLTVESLEHPERFPLVSRMPVARGIEAAGAVAVRERPPKYQTAKGASGTARPRPKQR